MKDTPACTEDKKHVMFVLYVTVLLPIGLIKDDDN